MYIPSSIFTLKDVPGHSELFCLGINPHMYCGGDGNYPVITAHVNLEGLLMYGIMT